MFVESIVKNCYIYSQKIFNGVVDETCFSPLSLSVASPFLLESSFWDSSIFLWNNQCFSGKELKLNSVSYMLTVKECLCPQSWVFGLNHQKSCFQRRPFKLGNRYVELEHSRLLPSWAGRDTEVPKPRLCKLTDPTASFTPLKNSYKHHFLNKWLWPTPLILVRSWLWYPVPVYFGFQYQSSVIPLQCSFVWFLEESKQIWQLEVMF